MKKHLFLIIILTLIGCKKNDDEPTQKDNNPLPIFESTTFYIDNDLKEISGLQIDGNTFYGFNDSGGNAELYKIDQEGEIVQTIHLQNATNMDWESMTMSDTHIFLADTGNNKGNRTDLSIYYFEKSALYEGENININTQKISFYYPEQTDFSNQNHNHDFDCEAIVWFNHQIHLFTKEWKSKKTHHYTLNMTNENQPAQLIEAYPTHFLVTGADVIQLDNQKSLLGIIGYSVLGDIQLIRTTIDNNASQFFNQDIEKTYLGNRNDLGQVEGIALASKKVLYYSAEKDNGIPPHITQLKQTN